MDILFLNVLRKPKPALLMAILFAASTEVFQLYFNRDGRLYDVAIDSLGAVLSFYTAQIFLYWNRKVAWKHSKANSSM
jgi:VanZ family protein